ncbi:MAG: hypothetical protein RLZZ174_2007 [Pseudomonadota bacterium]
MSETDREGLGRRSALVAAMTSLSRVLGLLRDVVLAQLLGAQPAADAFYVAFKIPNFFRRMFAEGAFSQGFVPVLTAYQQGEAPEAVRRLVAAVAGALGLVLLGLTALAMVFSDAVIALFAPGMSDDGRGALAAELLVLTAPYLLFISLTALAAGVQQVHGAFARPAITPLWLNVCLLAAAWLLAPWLGRPALALAWGVLLAGIVQFVFQLPALARLGYLRWPRLELAHPGVRRIATLMLPALFAASVSQINLLIDTILASLLVTGSVSWLYYGDRLMELPLGVFAIALATVLLPRLARHHSAGDGAGFSASLDLGLRFAALLTVPAAMALLVLALPLMMTLFQYGAMTPADAQAAAAALQAYALGLLGFSGVKVLAPGFFARQDTATPVRFATVAVLANIALNLALIGPLAHVGLALATGLAASLQAGLLGFTLFRRGLWRPGPGLTRFLLSVGGAALLMAAGLSWAMPAPAYWESAALGARCLALAGLVGLGLGLYLASLWALGYGPRWLRELLRQ